MRAMKPFALRTLPALLLAVAATATAGTVESTNPSNGLSNWQSEGTPFSLQLLQLMPDNVRAIYSRNDFPPALVEEMAGYCVFGSVIRNLADEPVSYDVADWRAITADGVRHRLRTKTDWLKIWQSQGVDFGWSILPAAQTLEVGDWGQGFTTLKLPHGSRFDLDYSWRQHGKTFHAILEGLQCAPEELPVPPRQP
ncbi:MAG: hypothetical protein M0Z73_11350 [Betaproteobacteria bacterium]|nr:hypothetical protein [Betaproteobacteria bacterium]